MIKYRYNDYRRYYKGKITSEQRLDVIDCLNNCIEQGDKLIQNLNWPKLKRSLSETEDELQRYQQYRDNVENFGIMMAQNYIQQNKSTDGNLKPSRKGISARMFEYISSEAFSAYIPLVTSIFFPDGAPDGDIRRALVEKVIDILG